MLAPDWLCSSKDLLFICRMRFLGSTTPSVHYRFAKETAGGVQGYIEVARDAQGATIHARLDVTELDVQALRAFDANCDGAIEAFKWHIHTQWHQTATSSFLGGCSLAIAGNHYDPDFACGPNSEHLKDALCAGVAYNCSVANPLGCERGDLSGKLGDMLVKQGRIEHSWRDPHYPATHEERPEWNMILHAVCANKATPRVACAIAMADTKRPDWSATLASWATVGVLLALLLVLYRQRHPLLLKYYPTNAVVAAAVAILGLLVYQYVLINTAL
ncbi:hypothetical protein SDRG_01296 [Saprolegnia diclina VS20]|uniref:Uncharacterized protein n=1 Tax=Saprolegnia diclina (strain VS20) TaxID=1156394 RepID=T0SEH0_SAPDV|nr:hypothetical protein SDRG_01296 [Saprolegnia diclina VS20]EQC41322.1 hypothetical protein SDRG_01296 [Saprolegnia diclina VS20]|eukprot:XP_008605036.1 hypothetical protein SDRG_01296 [Saprolegnia diclina VS20]